MNTETKPLSPKHREQLGRPIARVVFEVLLFAILGLILGISITFFFPRASISEPIWQTFLWLFFQLIVDALLLYVFDRAYIAVFGHGSDEYIGIVIFTNILFSCQVQLLQRIKIIYYTIIGVDLEAPVRS